MIKKDRWISTTSLAIADSLTWTVTRWPEQELSNHRAILTTWRTTALMIPSNFASSRNWKAVFSRPSIRFSRTLAPSMIAVNFVSPHPTAVTLSTTPTLARTSADSAITLWPLWPTFRYWSFFCRLITTHIIKSNDHLGTLFGDCRSSHLRIEFMLQCHDRLPLGRHGG